MKPLHKSQIEFLVLEIVRLRKALAAISEYDTNSSFGNGTCPYGCDCPHIAEDALTATSRKIEEFVRAFSPT